MTPLCIPLGIASAVPHGGRHLPSTIVKLAGRVIMFDCGEGTQFQLGLAGIKRSRLSAVFISHLHGDHLFGLPGLLSTLSLDGHPDPVRVFGPPGIAAFVNTIIRIGTFVAGYDIRVEEIFPPSRPTTVHVGEGYWVEAVSLDHRLPALGYRFQENEKPGHLDVERATALGVVDPRMYGVLKSGESVTVGAGARVSPSDVLGPSQAGGSLAYCFDTRPSDATVQLAENVDLLYHDATFSNVHAEKAASTGHSTAAEAAEVARQANAGRLLLGHFSGRYDNVDTLVGEARSVFPQAEAAVELQAYPLVSRTESTTEKANRA